MKRKIVTSIIIACLFFPFTVESQDSNFGNWLIYFGNKQINQKWNWHHEVQYRNYDAIGDLEQLLLRTGIGYNLSENNNNVLLGYGFIASENYVGNDKASVNEHRIYQQFITKQHVGSVKLSHRYRFEQRFVEDDFKMRFRYFLSFNIPLSSTKEEDKPSKWYLSAYNEIFLNTESDVFDRNRLYGGLGFRLNKAVRFELGYMNQFFETSSRDQLNVITFVSF